jgi:8-oxo-dGTP pyrophosphatase MutT (NUDIX family)
MAAQQLTSATHLLLYQDDALLMIRRHNTGYEDGNYSIIAGHIDPGEPARDAMRREAAEEAGIDVQVNDLEFVHAMHRHKADGTTKLDLFFRCTTWAGTPTNAEPHKCDHMDWFRVDTLPSNTIPYIRAALTAVTDRQAFSEFGWTSASVCP